MQRPLRIALVSEPFYPDLGGMPEHVHNLAQQLAHAGHDVTVITTEYARATPLSPPAAALCARYDVVRLGRATSHIVSNGSQHHVAVGLRLRAQMGALFAQRDFDLIHLHGPIFPTLALLAIHCAPPRAVLLGTLHTHFADSRLLRLLRRPIQRYVDALDGVIAVSESAVRSLERVGLHCHATRIENGIDPEYWQSGRPIAALRDHCFNVLVQARLEPRNDVRTVLAALRHLPDPARVRLIVVGDGPDRERLLREATGLNVAFVGPQLQARADLAASSDAYFFTATIASHPMSLLEGMAAGLPVLAFDIEGARELIRDEIEGFVVGLGRADQVACRLAQLIADPIRRSALAQSARTRAQDFAWPQIAQRVLAYYRERLSEVEGRSTSRERTGHPAG
ncbi:MAG: glycosyltransferase family 4 protein [Myxococcales bacterium]|nr:glycosyltransferase family 4 protein [Myxococcales bacterium]